MRKQSDILDFWFADVNDTLDNLDSCITLWWGKNDNNDQHIRDEFSENIEKAKNGEYDTWLATPNGRLALIILLDQFSRNIFRNDPKAYQQDAQALQLALDGIKKGEDKKLKPFERAFMYMPLEHAEDIDMQNQCVALFTNLRDEVDSSLTIYFQDFIKYAEQHRDIVEEFGHFPHRNKILSRATSEKEAAFLEQPGSSF